MCPNILCFHNDLHIYRCSQKEHNANLLNLMQIASDSGLVFNSRKCKI